MRFFSQHVYFQYSENPYLYENWWGPGQSLGGRVLDGRRRLGKSAWRKIWKYVVYLRPALRIDCRGDHLWRTVDRSLPHLTGAFLRAWLCLRHGAFWGCAPAPLTKLDFIDDWLIELANWTAPSLTSVAGTKTVIENKIPCPDKVVGLINKLLHTLRHYISILWTDTISQINPPNWQSMTVVWHWIEWYCIWAILT